MRVFFVFVPFLFAGCAASWSGDYARLGADLEPISVRHEHAPPGPATDPDLDRVLAGPLDLDALVLEARRRNPELREAAARAQAGLEDVRRAGSLDDPMFKLQVEAVPLRHPASPGKADDTMLGLSQSIPWPGNLSLRSETTLRDAEGLHQRYLDRERDVIARLKRAYFEYYSLSKELEIHLEHVKILEEFEKVSDVKFRNGAVSQQDVLKPQLEQVMLHNDVFMIVQRIGSAQAAINQLLNRPASAPLGTPREILPAAEMFDLPDLNARAMAGRPELRAAEFQVKGAATGLKLADREATFPDFAVGLDYWQIPGGPDAYGAMFSINLPWFTGKKSAEARRMERVLRADEAALDTVRGRVQFEVRDAFLRVESARKSLALFKGEILPKSAQGVEVSRASYEKDKASFLDLLDSERSLRDVKLKYHQALAQYESAVADLERAVGAELRRKP
jgi:cobalt-zinc-cadmium efflux system outer membrane protein